LRQGGRGEICSAFLSLGDPHPVIVRVHEALGRDLQKRQFLGRLVKEPVDLGAAEPIRLFLGFALPVELGEAGLVLAHALGRLFELGLVTRPRRSASRRSDPGRGHRFLCAALRRSVSSVPIGSHSGPMVVPDPRAGRRDHELREPVVVRLVFAHSFTNSPFFNSNTWPSIGSSEHRPR
jgi:hypothetical protein